jgi:hypothetical protein
VNKVLPLLQNRSSEEFVFNRHETDYSKHQLQQQAVFTFPVNEKDTGKNYLFMPLAFK